MNWQELGQRLRLARERSGFTQTEVAGELGMTAAALSQYEAGKRRIDALALDRFSRLYGMPVGYFLGEDHPTADWETALRGQAGELSSAGKQGVGELIQKVHDFEDLHGITDTMLPGRPHPPFEPLESRRFSRDEVEAWAERSRRHFDIGSAPVVNIREFLAAQGFQIFSIPFGTGPNDLSGLYFRHPELGPVVAVNEDRAYTRRPFTMAHELAHGLFHYHFPAVLCRGGDRDTLERFADHFAAQFLVPTDALVARLDDMQVRSVSDPRQVVHLSRYFGVSYEAMRWRLRAERKLQLPDDPRWKIAPLKMARQLGFTVSDYEFGERPLPLEDRFPRDFLDMALRGVQDGQLSLRRAAEMLDVSYLELEELMENDETALQEEIEEVYA